MESKPPSPNESKGEITLSPEQETKVLETWNGRKDNPPTLKELTQIAFGGEFDGRSFEGKAVKKFLASRQIKAAAAHEYIPKVASMSLTEEQKAFIGNNASSMGAIEIAKYLFRDKNITNLSAEVRLVRNHLKTLPVSMLYNEGRDLVEKDYKPPKTFEQTVFRINKYIHNGIEPGKATVKQKDDARALMGYLHSFRFSHCYGSMNNDEDRELFESSFISYTYDKSDLTAEEVDSYIKLALDVVNLAITQRQINKLTRLLEDCADDPEEKKISMSLAEAIHNAQTEYHQNKTRQQKLVQDLQGKRADRLSVQLRQNASILNLVELWKDDKEREKMIRLAQAREQALSQEFDRLSSVDELRAKVYGVSKEEILGFDDE